MTKLDTALPSTQFDNLPRVEVRTRADGSEQLVLHDEAALGMVRAIDKHSCLLLRDANVERLAYFAERMRVRGDDPKDVCITCIDANDAVGRPLAELLMPPEALQAIRDAGQHPVARGLASRPGLVDAVACFDAEAAEKLRSLEGPVVLVVTRGVAEVFPA